jgi:outer membrane receptor for monomeric catechols
MLNSVSRETENSTRYNQIKNELNLQNLEQIRYVERTKQSNYAKQNAPMTGFAP